MPRIYPIIESADYHRPSGLLASAIETFNATKLLLIMLSFIVAWAESIYMFNKEGNLQSLATLVHSIYSACFCSICLYFLFKRKSYLEFSNHLDNEVSIYASNEHIRKFLTKNRIITSMYYPIFFSFFLAYGIHCIYKGYDEAQLYGPLIVEILRRLFRSIIFLNYFLFVEFIIECCLNVQICFKMVLDQLESLEKSDRLLTVEQLQKIRSIYDMADEKTNKLDLLLLLVLPFVYLCFFISFHLRIAALMVHYGHFHVIIICRDIFTLFSLTFHVVSINRLANAAFDRVYSLSYKAHSLEIINEIRYFLTRIVRNDIGLTLLKIVLITPAFVTSIATISLTVGLSKPRISKY